LSFSDSAVAQVTRVASSAKSTRSAGRERRFERASAPNWWRRASTRAEGLDASTRRIESLQHREWRAAFARRIGQAPRHRHGFCSGRDTGGGTGEEHQWDPLGSWYL